MTELQVLKKGDTLDHGVLTVEGTVHVGNGLTGEDVSRDHLEESGTGAAEFVETDRGSKRSVEGTEDEGDDGKDSERPPRHARVTLVIG